MGPQAAVHHQLPWCTMFKHIKRYDVRGQGVGERLSARLGQVRPGPVQQRFCVGCERHKRVAMPVDYDLIRSSAWAVSKLHSRAVVQQVCLLCACNQV
jgi:hypothetical protein